MPEEEDDVVLPGTQPESQSSTQPLENTQPSEDTEPAESLEDTQLAEATQPVENTQPSEDAQPTQSLEDTKPLEEERTPVARNATRLSADRRTSEGSFHSAQEDIQQRGETVELMNVNSPAQQKVEVQIPQPSQQSSKDSEPVQSSTQSPEKATPAEPVKSQPNETESKDAEVALDNQFDDIGSPSDTSTPERPPIRKSSLTFASLPAREPLTTKKSMSGARISRTSHVDLAKMSTAGRHSYFGRQTGGPRTTQVLPEENDEKGLDGDKMDVDGEEGLSHGDLDMEMEASKLHNKSSTQRLHEKISMLGKLQPSRPTKSIPAVSTLAGSHVTYPELPSTQQETSKQGTASQKPWTAQSSKPVVEEDDEWIKPIGTPHRANLPKSHTTGSMEQHIGSDTIRERGKDDSEKSRSIEDSPAKRLNEVKPSNPAGLGHGKSASTAILTSPQHPGTPAGPNQKNASASNMAVESTTPLGSPKRYEGPLSASRSKLQSIMKTAKSLFTSSAGTSASPRMRPSSPNASRSQPKPPRDDNTASVDAEALPHQPSSPSRQEGRRTRSSTEKEEKRKEQELKDRQRTDEQLEKTREQEKQKAAHLNVHQEKPAKREEQEEAAPAAKSSPKDAPQSQKQPSMEHEQGRDPGHNREVEPRSAAPVLSHHQQPQQPKQNDRRPVKPTREVPQKPKPQPVSIRVGSTLSRQMPLSSTTSLSSSVHDPAPVPAPTPASVSKQSTISKKASTSSLHTAASTSSFKSSVSAQSQRKAQLAAERKREQVSFLSRNVILYADILQDEREARRREEQKRELERKRAAQQQQQQEEARRQELRNRAEAERRERERERLAVEEAKKAAQKQAIEKRRLENARRQESQQPTPAKDSVCTTYKKFRNASNEKTLRVRFYSRIGQLRSLRSAMTWGL